MDKKEIVILNDVSELRKLQDAVEAITDEWQLSMKLSMNLNLVLEEIVSNIIFYGYEDDAKHEIILDIIKYKEEIRISITDDAKAFDMMASKAFDEMNKEVEDRKIGGLGIHFVKTLMDRVEYKRVDEKNILILHKNIN